MEGKQVKPGTVDEYIAGFPPEVRERLEAIRATVRAAAPGAGEKMSYRMPTFFLNGNLVHFAAFKDHIGFYPTPSGIEGFRDELSGYVGGKGSVRFPHDRPLPLELIAKMVRYRTAEAEAKAKAKAKAKTKKG